MGLRWREGEGGLGGGLCSLLRFCAPTLSSVKCNVFPCVAPFLARVDAEPVVAGERGIVGNVAAATAGELIMATS